MPTRQSTPACSQTAPKCSLLDDTTPNKYAHFILKNMTFLCASGPIILVLFTLVETTEPLESTFACMEQICYDKRRGSRPLPLFPSSTSH